jgi:hypothetical protein
MWTSCRSPPATPTGSERCRCTTKTRSTAFSSAQADTEGLALVSADAAMRRYEVEGIW